MRLGIRLSILLLITAIVVASDLWIRVPMPSAAVPPQEFSAMRAIADAHTLLPLEVPHPVGSTANHAVRDRIIAHLRDLRFETTINAGDACSPIPHVKTCAYVENILATSGDESSAPNILLSAHYDSVSTGPGVSDDLVNVATLLEVARALQGSADGGGRPVSLLITDGEEPGLLGAELFSKTVLRRGMYALDINLEARGSRGPSLMFETSGNNAALVRAFARTVKFPHAASWMAEGGRWSANHTDLQVFKQAGLAGLNFAFLEGFANYHTPDDNFANLDPRSVQDQGTEVLALTRYFRDPRHATRTTSSAVYLDVLHVFVLRWPASITWPLIVLLWSVFFYVAWRATSPGLVGSILRALAAVLVTVIGIPALWTLILVFLNRFAHSALHRNALWILALFLAAALSASVLSITVLRRNGSAPRGPAGALLVLAAVDLLFLTLAATDPAATSLFLLQAVAVALGLFAILHSSSAFVIPLITAIYAVAAVILVPTFHIFYVSFGASMAPVAAIPCAQLVMHAFPSIVCD